ncbi:heavy-metal-associated domain-containing protein [Dehalobacter sp. DCM]|uniref:heavy-metal-associated domain-containing protein n=1 Tax=Dehalobacter sp. DCM TaxID=2907827 RepID=UPI003081D250|nr:heavy-metal-associated domain-containing protein [Dehalobacter sp. DCM]
MKKKIVIEGMSCNHCVNHVKEALSELAGVTDVAVDLAGKNAVIQTSSDIPDEQITAAIEDAGYEVKGIEAWK